ncbi:MAG: hypothetical protein ACFFBD_13915 [Candidatus Hodarchaeota archaeon]
MKTLDLDRLRPTPQYVMGQKEEIYLVTLPSVAGIYLLKFKTHEKSSRQIIQVPKCHPEFKTSIHNYYVSRWESRCTIPITADQYITRRALGYFVLLGETYSISSAFEAFFKVITKLQEESSHSKAASEDINLFQAAAIMTNSSA